MRAVNLHQPLQPAAVLREKPCSVNRTAPAGGKGEMGYAVLPEGGNHAGNIPIPYHFVEVDVFVPAVVCFFVKPINPDAALDRKSVV